jgi:hypothetical protein
MNWSYISGFFDGEGGITVYGRIGSNALALKVTICQKSLGVLRRIKAFLLLAGIYSVIYTFRNGMRTVEIGRADDLCRFLRSIKSIVKRRQVETAVDYLEGTISGNTLLKIYEEEYKKHKRKTNPLRKIGLRFPMTRTEAVEAAESISKQARFLGNRHCFLDRLERRVLSLPEVFGVKDIEKVIGVSKPRAQVIGNLMVREGFVKSHFERVPPRFRKKVFERLPQKIG